MSFSIKKVFFRILKVTGITIVSIFLLLFLLPYLFPGTIETKIKTLANKNLKGELNFSKARLSFFKHFPALTLSLYDFTLKGSAPFQQDTLVACKELGFGVDIPSLLHSKVDINKIFLTDALINIQVDKDGRANYNIYASGDSSTAPKTDSSSASLKLEKIIIRKSRLCYNDRSLPMIIDAKGFNYIGSGDLSKDIFDLQTHAEIDAVDFTYDKVQYVTSKKLNADLVTKINTNSLELLFEKNDLKINQLPIQFKGRFSFLKEGYDMDFNIQSKATELLNIFTALPPEYDKWTAKTEIKGTADIGVELAGQYVASKNKMPSLMMNMGIRSGYIAHEKTPEPVQNLFLNFNMKLPSLNTDSLYVNVDSVFFNIGKDYFSTIFRLTGLKEPVIYTKVNTDIDLEKWNKAFGLSAFDIKGRYSMHLLVDGKYAKGQNPKSIRPDTVIRSIPKFTLRSSFSNGYFKYASLPESVKDVSFNINGSCPDNNYTHVSLSMDSINAKVLDNFIKGYIKLVPGSDFPIEADLRSIFNLADIKKFYPLDSMDIKGHLDINVKTNGKYNAAKKLFPKTDANFILKDGEVQTKYYPHPIQKIQVEANVINTDGTMATTKVFVKPVSFEFEGQPFYLKAGLQNFNDLKYSIASNGTIDVGKIYQVFSQKGLGIKGLIKTNLVLRGLQSDATAGRYDQLYNEGKLEINDITITSEYFPLPFFIKKGVFSFKQDQMWFDAFEAKYGKSDFTLNGYLSNLINYGLKNEMLKGNFDLKSNKLVVDEFMAFADNSKTTTPAPTASTGVIIVPNNLDMDFTANVATVLYNGLTLTDAKGEMLIKGGTLTLNKTGFTLIGAPVVMDAVYASQSPRKATFDYHINAKDFDVQRAYKEIKIFHDLAPSAAKTYGIISLDYGLKGRLNNNMFPVYPSLEGGGTLSIKNVKVKGLKLFSAVSKATGRDSMSNPDISKVDIKTKIKNNLITIEPFKMRVMGFRPKMEGQVSFDGQLNIKFRLGLPPLGIFGIPMSITGTRDNPKVKLGRNKGQLEETEDKDEGDGN